MNEDFDPDVHNYEEQGIVRGKVRERINAGREEYRQAIIEKSARDAAFAAESRTTAHENESRRSEIDRLEGAINALGFTKEVLKDNFPAISENYSRVYRERLVNGIDFKSHKAINDNMFILNFGAILSLLESDEELSRKIISTWPEEYGKAMSVHEQIQRNRRK